MRQNNNAYKRVTELADFSILHDVGHLVSSVGSLYHESSGLPTVDVHYIQSSLNLADASVAADIPSAAVSAYSKVDKTGFIGSCADILERAIDLSHDLMQKLGVKDTYGFSIILLTIFSKSLQLNQSSSDFFITPFGESHERLRLVIYTCSSIFSSQGSHFTVDNVAVGVND